MVLLILQLRKWAPGMWPNCPSHAHTHTHTHTHTQRWHRKQISCVPPLHSSQCPGGILSQLQEISTTHWVDPPLPASHAHCRLSHILFVHASTDIQTKQLYQYKYCNNALSIPYIWWEESSKRNGFTQDFHVQRHPEFLIYERFWLCWPQHLISMRSSSKVDLVRIRTYCGQLTLSYEGEGLKLDCQVWILFVMTAPWLGPICSTSPNLHFPFFKIGITFVIICVKALSTMSGIIQQ